MTQQLNAETLKWLIEIEEVRRRLNPDKYNISFKYLNKQQAEEVLNFLENLK